MKSDAITQVSRMGEAQKAELLRLARAAAEAALGAGGPGLGVGRRDKKTGPIKTPSAPGLKSFLPSPAASAYQAVTPARQTLSPASEALTPAPLPRGEGSRFGGVFVTLWNGPRLRGCVGSVLPTDNICDTIQDVTRASLMDPRFRDHPPTAAELANITFEISLLSDPFAMAAASDLICGVHGIIVRRGERSGCFLPKVAAERGWSAEEFLSHCCTMKAGLPADAWREAGTQVLLFTAETFRDMATW